MPEPDEPTKQPCAINCSRMCAQPLWLPGLLRHALSALRRPRHAGAWPDPLPEPGPPDEPLPGPLSDPLPPRCMARSDGAGANIDARTISPTNTPETKTVRDIWGSPFEESRKSAALEL